MLSTLVTPARAGVQCLFCLALAGAGTAPARADTAPHVRVVFDGIEPPIEGVLVQVYDGEHLAPQLVVDNRTARPLEILDGRGRSMRRIRPQASWSGSDPRLDPGGPCASPTRRRRARRRCANVLGQEREPFLRISRAGVEANAASPTWQAFRHGRVTAGRSGPARWERISTEPRYRWRDPRAGRPGPGEALRNWEVPVRIGSRSAAIRGVTEWQPAVY